MGPINPKFENRPWSCPICKISDEKFLGLRGGRSHRYQQGIESTIVQCRRCSLVYPNPFPIPLNSEDLYGDPESYFARHNPTEKIRNSQVLLREITRRVGHPPRVLDVGSGCGEILVAAKKVEINATGLEFSDAMIRYGKERFGVEIHKLSVEEAAAKWPSSYDAVILNAVLEHVYHPDQMIQAVSQLLKPSGILYIDVPNEPNLLTAVGNSLNRLRGNRAVYNLAPTWPPYHVYGFNPQALKILLSKHSLKIEDLKIWADPTIPSDGRFFNRVKALVAKQINQVANVTRTAGNMAVWARRI